MRYKFFVLMLLFFATSCSNDDIDNKKITLSPELLHDMIYSGEIGEDFLNIQNKYMNLLNHSMKTKKCGPVFRYNSNYRKDKYPRRFFGASNKDFITFECNCIKGEKEILLVTTMVWHKDTENIKSLIEGSKGIEGCDIPKIRGRCFTINENIDPFPPLLPVEGIESFVKNMDHVVSIKMNIEYEIIFNKKNGFNIEDFIGFMETAIDDFYDEHKKEQEGPPKK